MDLRRSAPVIAMMVVVLAGCGGGSSDSGDTPTADPAATSSAATTPKATPSATTPAQKVLSTKGRVCTKLEEPLRLYPGHPLSMANRGTHLDEVQEMQSMLNGAGDGSHCIPEDGDFGPVTRDAVKKFQTANSLTVDGLVGEETWNQLNLLLSH